MGQIKAGVNIVRYTGAALVLKGAGAVAWATNIQVVYRAHPTSGGWQSLQPNNSGSFDAFSNLEDGGTYYLHGATGIAPFEVAGINANPVTWWLEIVPVSGITNGSLTSGANATIRIDRVFSDGSRLNITEDSPSVFVLNGEYDLLGGYTAATVTGDTTSIIAAQYNDGVVTRTASLVLSILEAGNISPAVNAGADQTVTTPVTSRNLTGTASDSDGTIASTVWSQVSGPSSVVINNPNILSTYIEHTTGGGAELEVGVYVFRLTVTDNEGAVTTDDVVITIQEAPNTSPIVHTPIADRSMEVGSSQNLTLSNYFSDPEEDAISYTATTSDVSKVSYSIASGVLTINALATTTTDVTITVTATDTGSLNVTETFLVTVVAASNDGVFGAEFGDEFD